MRATGVYLPMGKRGFIRGEASPKEVLAHHEPRQDAEKPPASWWSWSMRGFLGMPLA
jgi:hypothetical protein